MRLFIVGVALLLFTTTSAAQSRWTLSAGPEWQPYLGGRFLGGRMRGEFDMLKPDKPFRLRVELGGYWEPTQDRFGMSVIDGSTYSQTRQTVDLSFGFSAAVTPLPRARFAPYLTLGILARQSWIRGADARFPPSGQPTYNRFSGTLGDFVYPAGLGVRARIGRRVLQFELRRFLGGNRNALMAGTSLPF
jgi:hypothetical protein